MNKSYVVKDLRGNPYIYLAYYNHAQDKEFIDTNVLATMWRIIFIRTSKGKGTTIEDIYKTFQQAPTLKEIKFYQYCIQNTWALWPVFLRENSDLLQERKLVKNSPQ